MIHKAGKLGDDGIQFCDLCGFVLTDYRGAMVPIGDPPLCGWAEGAFVDVTDGAPVAMRVTTELPTCVVTRISPGDVGVIQGKQGAFHVFHHRQRAARSYLEVCQRTRGVVTPLPSMTPEEVVALGHELHNGRCINCGANTSGGFRKGCTCIGCQPCRGQNALTRATVQTSAPSDVGQDVEDDDGWNWRRYGSPTCSSIQPLSNTVAASLRRQRQSSACGAVFGTRPPRRSGGTLLAAYRYAINPMVDNVASTTLMAMEELSKRPNLWTVLVAVVPSRFHSSGRDGPHMLITEVTIFVDETKQPEGRPHEPD